MSVQTEAARAAERLLSTVWGQGVPVDPVQIARALGIKVLDARLDANVAAALVKRPGQDPSILLNAGDSANRRRFSCAHEIGHFVKHADEPDQYEYIDFRDALSATGQNPEEVYANTFAASLLMPEKEVRRLHKEGFGEVEMAAIFGVSAEAMHYRLKNLGLAH